MNTKSKMSALIAVVAAVLAGPALATPPQQLSLDDVVEITGMKEQEVRLMVGARSTNPLYLTSYYRIEREWKNAVQEAGLIVTESRDANGRVAGLVVSRPVSES